MTILSSFCELLQLYKLPLHFNKLSTADMRTLNIYYGFCSSCLPYFVHRRMLLSKLKNSGPKLMCTGPGPTNTRDEVMVTAEYLGCTGAPATLDSDTSHYNNHHAHYITSSVSPYPRPSSAAVSWSCGVVSTRYCRDELHHFKPTDLNFRPVEHKTSLPYFGVKLSCVCLMFSERK